MFFFILLKLVADKFEFLTGNDFISIFYIFYHHSKTTNKSLYVTNSHHISSIGKKIEGLVLLAEVSLL